MLIQPVAPSRARRSYATPAAALRRGSLLLTAFSALAVAALPAGAQSAADILKKSEALYTKAASYQGSLVIKTSGKDQNGKPATLTQTQVIKYVGPNKVRVQVSAIGTGSAKAQAANLSSTTVSDGKTFTIYNSSLKQYVKQPAPPALSVRQLLARVLPASTSQGLKLVAPSQVAGRPVFVLELKPAPPPNLTAQQKAEYAKMKPLQLMIDKQNYQLLKIRQTAANGSVDISLNGQTFKPNLPGSTFAFTPPAGAKEFVPPANPPGGPGAPGGPPPSGNGGAP